MNIFGNNMPQIRLGDGTLYQLPNASRNGREETFVSENKTYGNINRRIRTRTRGFRLNCTYTFNILEINDDWEMLSDIYSRQNLGVFLKFQTHPRWFEVYVSDFNHTLSNGLVYFDAATIRFIGTTLFKEFPNPDNAFSLKRMTRATITI